MPNPMITTMEDIERIRDDFLNVETVANVLHINPDRLRGYLRSGELDVTVRKSGNRIMISRESLLNWYHGKKPEPEETKTEKLLGEMITELRVQNAVMMGILIHLDPALGEKIIEKCEAMTE